MLIIRFLRVGKRNQPFFKIVVTDKKNSSRSGKFLEKLGFYDPLNKERGLKIERIKYWISKGAKLSARVHNLLVSEKVIKGDKIKMHNKSKKKKEEAEGVKSEETKSEEKTKTEEDKIEEVKTVKKKKGEKLKLKNPSECSSVDTSL